jgi:hypothetical protein
LVRIQSSDADRDTLQDHFERLNLPALPPILDMKNRWNSTYDMIKRALDMRAAIDLTMASQPTCRLTDSDWNFLETTMVVLQPFEEFNKKNSGSSHSTINLSTASFVSLRNELHGIVQRMGMYGPKLSMLTYHIHGIYLQRIFRWFLRCEAE